MATRWSLEGAELPALLTGVRLHGRMRSGRTSGEGDKESRRLGLFLLLLLLCFGRDREEGAGTRSRRECVRYITCVAVGSAVQDDEAAALLRLDVAHFPLLLCLCRQNAITCHNQFTLFTQRVRRLVRVSVLCHSLNCVNISLYSATNFARRTDILIDIA